MKFSSVVRTTAALFVGAVFAAAAGYAGAAEPTLAQVNGGLVRGKADDGLIVFKGIPFAAPPVGNLRWRAPQPVVPWDGVRPAFAFSHDPIQPRPTLSLVGTSEDCLYLNVWRPEASEGKRLAVLVWIYGGGLVKGGASLYPGEYLARQGIVVVTFNYRVGRLGFFAHPALARETPDDPCGNYGYMDQIAVLQWVRHNIVEFGGDPHNVTIAGESAGGGSVLVLMTSPLARGLFHRAILQSSGIPSARAAATPMRSLAAAESIAVEYARGAKIGGDDRAVLKALRALPARKLGRGIGDYVLAIAGGPEVPGLSHAIIDGRLVVEAPETILRRGQQAMVPVIAGANDYDLAITPAQTKHALLAPFGGLAPRARELYDPTGLLGFYHLRQAVSADRGMIEPSRHLAELMTAAGQPAYYYRFAYVPTRMRHKWKGAPHAGEIPFVFDCLSPVVKCLMNPEDEALARTMSGYWVAFVKTGDPNGGGRPEWLRYNPATRDVMCFTNAGVTMGPDPLKERLDLWKAVWERSR